MREGKLNKQRDRKERESVREIYISGGLLELKTKTKRYEERKEKVHSFSVIFSCLTRKPRLLKHGKQPEIPSLYSQRTLRKGCSTSLHDFSMSDSSNFTFSPLNLKYFAHILGIYHVLKLKAPSNTLGFLH